MDCHFDTPQGCQIGDRCHCHGGRPLPGDDKGAKRPETVAERDAPSETIRRRRGYDIPDRETKGPPPYYRSHIFPLGKFKQGRDLARGDMSDGHPRGTVRAFDDCA